MIRFDGSRLRALRKERGLRREAVAAAIDVPLSTVVGWERGRTIPSAHQVHRLELFFGCQVGWFEEEARAAR